jgi:hypothetical protein
MKKHGWWLKGKFKEEHNNWKGEGAKYIAKHMWIYRHHGKASMCEVCGIPGKKLYEWANISGLYKREMSDWKQMCPSCHRKMDFSRTGKCRKGHEMTTENTYWRRDGNRACRACNNEGLKRYRDRLKSSGMKIASLILIIMIVFTSCATKCPPATEKNVNKWMNKNKFRAQTPERMADSLRHVKGLYMARLY